MGRKAPKPKRHFGVRDPLEQLRDREEKIKDKVNNPPAKDENQQTLSKKMRQFVQLKTTPVVPKPRKKKRDEIGQKAQMIRLPNETEEHYLKRLNRLKNARLKEALYAAKYSLKIDRNEKTGELKINQRKPNEIDELIETKRGKKVKSKSKEVKLTPLEKLKLKKYLKREKRLKEKEDFEPKREFIPFGEVVSAPPTLVTPRLARKSENEGKSRPGKRDLLLNKILEGNSAVEKERQERERLSVVQMYKDIKKKKRIEGEASESGTIFSGNL